MSGLSLAAAVRRALGVEVVRTVRVHGGDVAEAFRVLLSDGRTVFAKTRDDPPPYFFGTEAASLSWLREAGALPVPQVLAVQDRDDGTPLLVLEWIEEDASARPDEAAFGRGLADLHRAGAPCFGRTDRRTTGSRRLPNEPHDRWAEFYATERLLPLARQARETGALPEHAVRDLERVAERLDDLGVPVEPPARLHGDLWAGNRLVDRHGRSWVVDPAAHGGHREFDLAMMRLFGGFGTEAFEAYHDAFPLADGFEHRVPIHQLAPLTVHAIKFGGGYVSSTLAALARLV